MPSFDPAVVIPPPVEGTRYDRDHLDLAESEMRQSKNWIRRNGRLITRPGISLVESSDAIGETPTSIIQYTHPDEDGRIVVATVDGWHLWNGDGTWTDITGNALTGTRSSPTIFRTMDTGTNKYLLGTNGVNIPKVWDGDAATYSDMGGSAPSAKCMAVAFNRVLLGNITSGANASPQAVYVSDYRDPDNGWGNIIQFLLDVDGDIVAMESIGNRKVGVYMEDGLYLATAIADLQSFRFDLHSKGIAGPASSKACIATPYGHIYLAMDGTLRVFNGSSLNVLQRNEEDDRIHAYLRATMSYDDRELSWLAYDQYYNELHVRYVEVGDETVLGGFIVNMADLSLWPIRFPNHELCAGVAGRIISNILYRDVIGTYADQTLNYADFGQVRNRVVAVDSDGKLYEFNGNDDVGLGVNHYLETGLRFAGDPRQKFVIRHANHLLEPTVQSGQQINVQFGASQRGEPRVLETAKTLQIGAGDIAETHHMLRGSMFSLYLSGTAWAPIEYRGSQVVADPVGFR
jgi:hypothetical protein